MVIVIIQGWLRKGGVKVISTQQNTGEVGDFVLRLLLLPDPYNAWTVYSLKICTLYL